MKMAYLARNGDRFEIGIGDTASFTLLEPFKTYEDLHEATIELIALVKEHFGA